MATVHLPVLSRADFAAEVASLAPEPLPSDVVDRLFGHYEELRRWSARLALVGPGTVGEIMGRHYGESLAALPWVPATAGRLLDLGSGAGFPGLVLAAARPQWEVSLVESRQKKWAFLLAAARRAGLVVRCLDVRVAARLPEEVGGGYDLLTARAVKLPEVVLEAPGRVLAPNGRLILWVGEERPPLPPGWVIVAERPVSGRSRRIVVAEAERGAP